MVIVELIGIYEDMESVSKPKELSDSFEGRVVGIIQINPRYSNGAHLI